MTHESVIHAIDYKNLSAPPSTATVFNQDGNDLFSPEDVVARGLIVNNIPNGEIRLSNVHGYGLFASENIPAGIMLCKLDGQKIDYDTFCDIRDGLHARADVKRYIFMEWNSLPDSTLLYRACRSKYSYINHSRQASLMVKGNPPELWTIADVSKGEEMFLDYRNEPLPIKYIQNADFL